MLKQLSKEGLSKCPDACEAQHSKDLRSPSKTCAPESLLQAIRMYTELRFVVCDCFGTPHTTTQTVIGFPYPSVRVCHFWTPWCLFLNEFCSQAVYRSCGFWAECGFYYAG